MKTRKYLLMCLLVVGLGVLFAATRVSSFPTGVPVPAPGPLSCTTTNFTITAVTGPNNQFPIQGSYGYTVAKKSTSSKSFKQVVVAVSADQGIASLSSTPTGTTSVKQPGQGDSGFLAQAKHEYTVRFSFNANVTSATVRTVIEGPTSPRLTTVLVRRSSDDDDDSESCLIAGPGVNVAPPGPLASQQCTAFDSRLFAKITRGPDGCQVNQAQFFLDSPTCSGTPLGGNFVAGPFPPAATDLYCASLDAKGCAECVKASKQPNSPITFEYTLPSGDTLVICYDPDQSDFVCR